MQCLDFSKSWSVIGTRSVIGTLVATEDGEWLVAFFQDEFDLDMNTDPSISTTPSMGLQYTPYLCEGLNI